MCARDTPATLTDVTIHAEEAYTALGDLQYKPDPDDEWDELEWADWEKRGRKPRWHDLTKHFTIPATTRH